MPPDTNLGAQERLTIRLRPV